MSWERTCVILPSIAAHDYGQADGFLEMLAAPGSERAAFLISGGYLLDGNACGLARREAVDAWTAVGKGIELC